MNDHAKSSRSDKTAAALVVRPSSRRRAALHRAEQRKREVNRVVRPVVSKSTESARRPHRTHLLVVLGLSVALHAAVGMFAFVAGMATTNDRVPTEREVVTIREIIRPIKTPEIEAAPVQPEVLPAPMPEPPKQPPRKAAVEQAQAEPAPDPVDLATPAAPETPRRRIVGLSFESTAQGKGPAYAVGNTRMGKTGETASAPQDAGPRIAATQPQTSGNEVATFVPTQGRLEKPRRVSKVELPYPTVLMARGVEGDVVVRIHILDDGSVDKVDVVRSSGHDEFDSAARRAALRERFSPARRSGEAVEYVLEYTYRFRLKDA